MNIVTFSRMLMTSERGWDEIEKINPPLPALFAYLVLPLALLPPTLLHYAGMTYGDDFTPGFGGRPWATVAAVFLLAELLSYAWMGWFIKQVADAHKVPISVHDAYTLAAIAPIPLWLSSIGLLIPNLMFNIALALAALAASCALIYRGVRALCHMHEDVTAQAIVQTVIGAGVAAWTLLVLLIFNLP